MLVRLTPAGWTRAALRPSLPCVFGELSPWARAGRLTVPLRPPARSPLTQVTNIAPLTRAPAHLPPGSGAARVDLKMPSGAPCTVTLGGPAELLKNKARAGREGQGAGGACRSWPGPARLAADAPSHPTHALPPTLQSSAPAGAGAARAAAGHDRRRRHAAAEAAAAGRAAAAHAHVAQRGGRRAGGGGPGRHVGLVCAAAEALCTGEGWGGGWPAGGQEAARQCADALHACLRGL